MKSLEQLTVLRTAQEIQRVFATLAAPAARQEQ